MFKRFTLLRVVAALAWMISPAAVAAEPAWQFVSMPDFLNVDTDYPQPGWEDSLTLILESVKAERPDFLLVAGDLVMGRWDREKGQEGVAGIEHFAARYYPAWVKRLEAHGLPFYAALGDHDVGDNPWHGARAELVPHFKKAFRDHLKMPLNGPEHMKGTAYWWRHKNVLFVAVDVFEKGQSNQGGIRAGVTGKQLAWLEQVLEENRDADHVVVMGHTPVLGPVRKWSSSGLMLTGGRESPFWQTLGKHHVDLYLCGEVHAITCTRRDGVEQVAHGGLVGYNPRTNYLVARVCDDRLELELKELDMLPSGKKLWQPGSNRPLEKVDVPAESRARGFVPVGRLTIDKRGATKRFVGADGYFLKAHETSTEFAVPVFSKPGKSHLQELPRIELSFPERGE